MANWGPIGGLFFGWGGGGGGGGLKGPQKFTFKKNLAVLVSINMHKA